MKTMATTEEVSSDGMEKPVERRNWRQIACCAREKRTADLKKVLANPWKRKNITKRPTPFVGKQPNGKCQIKLRLS